MGTGRILVVDDEITVVAVLEGVLEDPWTVATATSAPAALELMRQEGFDLLLVDKNMPEMDGVEMVRALREAGNPIPIVMITGYASPASAAETLNLGIDAYIEKPFGDIFAIRDVVARVLGQRRPRWVPVPAPAANQPGLPLKVLLAARREGLCERLWHVLDPDRDDVVVADEPPDIVAALQRELPDLLVLDVASYWDEFTELITNLRHYAPDTSCVVLSERLALAEIKLLIDLGVKALIDQDSFAERLGDVIRLARYVKLGDNRRDIVRTGPRTQGP
jgi:CheY-like chemotaxis protein